MNKQHVINSSRHRAIIEGRGEGIITSPAEIQNSEVVILWGHNFDTDAIHMPWMENKTLIVIDPVQTELAKKANLHIQIRPQTDIYLALLLSRFLYINGGYDKEFLEKYASEFEDFYELTQTIRIKSTLDLMDISLGMLGNVLELIADKKVMIVSGMGIQKYTNAEETLRAIDGFAVMLGLFGKEGCGAIYSDEEITKNISTFCTKSAKVSKAESQFDGFNTDNKEFVFLDEIEIKYI
ncbi:MAG: molybdopterin-dependent oxidoreductase [Sulfurimonadaceae bacterium]|jgi:anaerobic selenocysteine-containing dehydrogenase|nr:molybdopterin-dependent oxidoreductase [Sulfurimonadaceae bacterium]